MARYPEQRPDGSWRKQRAIPADLVTLVGDGKLIKRNIGHMRRTRAEELSGEYAAEHSKLFAMRRHAS
jgi:hypothetical protein